jgi:hypothetical protein
VAQWAGAAFVALAAHIGGDSSIPAFSAGEPGNVLPPPWHEQGVFQVPMSQVRLVEDEGQTVLQVHSKTSIGTAAIRLRLEKPVVAWRWKVDRVLAKARLGARDGDDFAARVFVTFEFPAEELSFGERTRLALARLFYGHVPSAAICYVWDNGRDSKGQSVWSPYAERVRLVVLRNAIDPAGAWLEERRDVAADFRAAFGRDAPPISGIAAGNDTDQTSEVATAWFGDFRVEPK